MCQHTHTSLSPSHINFPILITSNYIAERVLMQSNLAELSRWRRTAHSKMSWSCDKSYWNKQLLDNPTHWWIKSSEDKTLRVLAPTPPYQARRWDSGSNEVKQFFLFFFLNLRYLRWVEMQTNFTVDQSSTGSRIGTNSHWYPHM